MLSSEGSLLAALIVFAKTTFCVLKWTGELRWSIGEELASSFGGKGAALGMLQPLIHQA